MRCRGAIVAERNQTLWANIQHFYGRALIEVKSETVKPILLDFVKEWMEMQKILIKFDKLFKKRQFIVDCMERAHAIRKS